MTAPLMVDVEGWLIGRLTDTVAAGVDTRTPADTQDDESWLPFVQVHRVGGPTDGLILDIPTVQFDCFALGSQQAANLLALNVRAAVHALRGIVTGGAVLSDDRTLSGPSWAPTTNPALRHAALLMQLRILAA